jgi:phosphoglycolate phosphatase-like HAD superfamily hydrolase
MPNISPTILALDFDGVICNGLKEYFQTTWQAYHQIWQTEIEKPKSHYEQRFYELRPVIETGWEMPILLRALVIDVSPKTILRDWSVVRDEIMFNNDLEGQTVAEIVDGVRDRAINTHLDAWLNLHSFYPGVISRLKIILASEVDVYIVTTKEGRFVQQLLKQQEINFPKHKIIGKEAQQPKPQTLRKLLATPGDTQLWFVEDRLETLHKVQQAVDLQAVVLFLADWGYNTIEAKKCADNDDQICVLSLENFSQDFAHWVT